MDNRKEDGKDIKGAKELQSLKHPNGYLTDFEFKRLLVNVYLLQGEVFVVKDGKQLHIMKELHQKYQKKVSNNLNMTAIRFIKMKFAKLKILDYRIIMAMD